ncbi:hypothetical protein ABZP36_010130 [Zizania latifolia]
MQLYAKEIECPPGASTVASVFSRNLQNRGLDSSKPGEVKDLVWKICAWRDVMLFISQKTAIQKCNLDGKPVIITRVVDNMIDNLRPTRAEATDVANAVLDGTDGILLGAETVRGPYPVDVVTTVGRICAESVHFKKIVRHIGEPMPHEESVASSAVRTAIKVKSATILVFTFSGRAARCSTINSFQAFIIQVLLLIHSMHTVCRLVAKYKPPMPMLAVVFPREGSDPTEYGSSCQLGPEDARSICLREYGSAPDINIYGDLTFIFPHELLVHLLFRLEFWFAKWLTPLTLSTSVFQEMEIPVIKMNELHDEKRSEALSLLHDACAHWGFFWLENHGINEDLMIKIKGLVNKHYEQNMEKNFYDCEMAKNLGPDNVVSNVDWESSFMYHHQPELNINDIPELLRTTFPEYAEEVIKLAEQLAEVMSENLGLDKDYLKKAFSEPSVGIKVAKYPRCSHPELVMGLRGHADAGGIILLLQDELVPGLEFLKDGRWMPIPPTQGNRIIVNLGDQIEVMSNGIYKSICHHVVPNKNGSRLSIATFYNPGPDAIVFPATKLTYPSQYRFKDYLDFYSTTKFTDKVSRFQTTKLIFK